jgi:formylglycine-generating enzyme required for sulfatase activity
MKRFKKKVFLVILCVNFCLAGSIMAAESVACGDFESSVKQGVVEFFNAVRQEQYEKLGFGDSLERDGGQFVSIPGGTYEIGSPPQEASRGSNEKLHSIELSEFSIMDAAVTQESYAKVMGTNPSHFQEQKYCPQSYKEIDVKGQKIPVCADHPVEMVSWDDAKKFAELLSKQNGKYKYSLPTEAQLEVAFRGGTKTAYVSGRDDETGLGDYVWYSANSGSQTHPVRSIKFANKYDVYRSSVWEWAQDWYDENYAGSTGLDPQGPTSGSHRVFRGGGWGNVASGCRSAFRYVGSSDARRGDLGFRLVRT